MIELKDFQKTAIDQLSLTFLDLWKTGKYRLPLVFKAPTGAGKTVMIADFLRCLDDNYQFHEDKAYLWVSFGGDESYSQSRNNLYDYFNEGTDMHLKNLNNLSEGKLYKNNIFFINWSKIKGTDKESRKLRRSGGVGYGGKAIFDDFIQKTKKERNFVLIVDEAHTETNTHLANEVIDLIDPRIILKITATPKDLPSVSDVSQKKAGFVEALESDVIASGLIKEKIIIQTEEDIKKLENKKLSEDEIMLELAYNKRLELKKYYKELGLDINPLVLIQLPSDFKEKEEVQANQKEIVLRYLKSKGVKENEIAIWLSGNKDEEKLKYITDNNDKINFMIFKVAPATGWDCPRADILVMFREITSPTFHTQIIGRIKRMPEAHHYEKEELNRAFIYTNYNKSHIKSVKEIENGNKPPIYYTKLKKGIERITLTTTYHQRVDFNTLTPEDKWQKFFKEFLDTEFGTIYEVSKQNENHKKIESDIDLKKKNIDNQIVVNAEIESFDNFVNEIKEKGKDFNYHFSQLDVERLYNLLCFEELRKQGDEEAKYNPSRSWGPLKKALNVWFSTRIGLDRSVYYPIIVNELLKESSKLKTVIGKALKAFRKKYEIEIRGKEGGIMAKGAGQERLLEGYRVLDLADEKGVYCTKLLADLGADVIVVEPSSGSKGRHRGPFFHDEPHVEKSLYFLYFNTSKRSITLNLEHPDGQAIFKRLAKTADVVVETSPVGYMKSLGLDYDALSGINPKLVMTSISPFGQTGPYKDYKSSDLVAMAMGGYMQITGDPEKPPVRLGNEHSHYPAPQYAALGILGALYYRDISSGRGQYIDMSLFEPIIPYHLEQHQAAMWKFQRQNPIRVGLHSYIGIPLGVYPCKDGWAAALTTTNKEWDDLAQ